MLLAPGWSMLRATGAAAKPTPKVKSAQSMCKVGQLRISHLGQIEFAAAHRISEKNILVTVLHLKGKAAPVTDWQGKAARS